MARLPFRLARLARLARGGMAVQPRGLAETQSLPPAQHGQGERDAVSATMTYSGQAPTVSARVRWLISGTRASSTACCQVPLRVISRPLGATIALTPIVERDHHGAVGLDGPDPRHGQLLQRFPGLPVHLERGVVGLHREQVRAAATSEPTQPSKPIS